MTEARRPDTEGVTARHANRADQPPAHSIARGAVLYVGYCAPCHGRGGDGDGPVTEVLALRPRDLRDSQVVARSSDRELIDRLLTGEPLRAVPRRNPEAENLSATELLAYIPTLATADWDLLRAGRLVYEDACAPCHGTDGRGHGVLLFLSPGPPGDLLLARERLSDATLAAFVHHGSGAMPAMEEAFAPGEVRAVIAYIRHLSTGAQLYGTYCAACHGEDGQGADARRSAPAMSAAPPLDAGTLQRLGPKAARAKVLHMVRREAGMMPHFRDVLTEEELGDIVAYLRTW
jgi:mono/diheme cytochrome c family protein